MIRWFVEPLSRIQLEGIHFNGTVFRCRLDGSLRGCLCSITIGQTCVGLSLATHGLDERGLRLTVRLFKALVPSVVETIFDDCTALVERNIVASRASRFQHPAGTRPCPQATQFGKYTAPDSGKQIDYNPALRIQL